MDNFKIIILDEKFEILKESVGKNDKNPIKGLCYENNRLFATDHNNCTIKVYTAYNKDTKTIEFEDNTVVKLEIKGYHPIDIKVKTLISEETMVFITYLKQTGIIFILTFTNLKM